MNPKRKRLRGVVLFLGLAAFAVLVSTTAAAPHPFHDDLGVTPWRASWAAALQEAGAFGKPLYIELSKDGCGEGAAFAAETLTDKSVRGLLRRQFVCVALDFDHKPPKVEQLCKARNLTTTPVHLFLSANGEFLTAPQRMIKPPDFEKTLQAILADPRVATAKAKDKEIEKQAQYLSQALEMKDGKKVAAALQTIEKIPGLSPAKSRAYAVLDKAEEPVWDKFVEAAKFVRSNNYILAQVALEEAAQLADHLPAGREIQSALAALPALEEATLLEAKKEARWKEKAAAEYQKVLMKYADSPLAVVAQNRLRALLKK